jgi:phosphoglycolate phosphatase (TIGR01487 family)
MIFVKRRTFAVDIDGTITENGGGRIHLDSLEALRRLTDMGHNVIYVTGRSSVEAFLLAVYGGTTKIAVGENGGCVTFDSDEHTLLGNLEECNNAFQVIENGIDNVKKKHVFPRMTEVVLERTFDLDLARKIMSENNIDVELSDSQYAYHINSSGIYHINSSGIDKGSGFSKIMNKLSILRDDVIAIGDSATDVPLFRVAKTSVALGNASEQVKSEATMTVSANAGDGVLEALDKLAPTLSEI